MIDITEVLSNLEPKEEVAGAPKAGVEEEDGSENIMVEDVDEDGDEEEDKFEEHLEGDKSKDNPEEGGEEEEEEE